MKIPNTSIMVAGLLTFAGLADAQNVTAPTGTAAITAPANGSSIESTNTSTKTELDRKRAPVQSVTVFPGWACVTRRAKASVSAGQSRLVLAGLPAWIDTTSLQARVSDGANARLLGARCTRTENPFISEEAIKAEKKQIAELATQIAEAEGRRKPLADELDYLNKLMPWRLEKTGEESKVRPVTAAEIREVSEYLTEARLKIASQQAEINREVAALTEQQETRTKALDEAIKHPPLKSTEIHLDLQIQEAGTVSIELSYIVAGASWYPEHALTLDSESGKAQLRLQAIVQQATGESWEECQIRVSSAPPLMDGYTESMPPWKVAPLESQGTAEFWALLGPGMGPRAHGILADLDKIWQQQPSEDTETKQAIERVLQNREQMRGPLTQVVARGIVADLSADSLCTIQADGSPITVGDTAFGFDPTFEYTARPAILPAPLATLRLENTRTIPILPGWISCYRDGRMLQKVRSGGAQTGETLSVPVGTETALSAERSLDRKNSRLDTLGDKHSLLLHYSIKLANSQEHASEVTLLETMPVNTNKGINIGLISATPRAKIHATGMLEWKVTVPANGSEQITYSYQIDYTGDRPPLPIQALVDQVKNTTRPKAP